jgi:pectate lyase
VGGSDESFEVGGNINCTAFTSGSFSLQVAYTDETNTAQTANFQGHFTSGYGTTVTGTGPFEAQIMQIRCKASTTITIKTVGTFTNLTYNAQGTIKAID